MAEAGFNVVRLAEFAWSRLEPKEGHFNFGWLDRAIDLLSGHSMKIVLGTPTASPPPWVMSSTPEFFLMREDGRRATYGHRREYCPNHPGYHGHTRRIVQKMAEHYAGHPAVLGWQIDNEFGDRCFCPRCIEAFQGWLKERYNSLDALNECWGTIFWSHEYTAWEQISAPLSSGGQPNPGLALDYYRFCSDSYVAYQQIQADILRRLCPGQFITHNFMGFKYDQLNLYDLAAGLDFVSWDNYPRTQWTMDRSVDPARDALEHDTMRGLKQRPFWVMEQQAGPAGWDIVSPAPRPGQLRLWAYQAVAHGADGIVFFRWRTARTGSEQYWHGLLDQHGRPGRRYDEIRQMGAEIVSVGERLLGTEVAAQVAMLHSFDSRFAFQSQANNPGFRYETHFAEVYRALHALHVPVDVVPPTADLSEYKLVVAPALHVVDEEIAANLRAYVSSGGVLAVTPRSGVKDSVNRVVDMPLPGLLAGVCGVEVEEYDSLPLGDRNAVRFVAAGLPRAESPATEAWADVLRPEGAEVVATYLHDYYAGRPAITLNKYGEGRALYLGAFGKQDLLLPLTRWLLEMAQVPLPFAPAEDVEVVERRRGEQSLLFVLNHSSGGQEVEVAGDFRDLLTGCDVHGVVNLGPYGVAILENAKGEEP